MKTPTEYKNALRALYRGLFGVNEVIWEAGLERWVRGVYTLGEMKTRDPKMYATVIVFDREGKLQQEVAQ